ncbi:MAG: carboxypeptidase-like regulatory domain-containing protein, partial [Bacteroidota bacterium]
KLFFRNSYYTYMDKNMIKLKKSSIPEINQGFIDSILTSVPKTYDDHAEVLGDMYGKLGPQSPQKMDMFKATYLYDKENEITFENYERRFNEIFRKYVKRDSYFKIKSGIFGTKEEIDSSMFGEEDVKQAQEQTDALLKEQQEKEKKRKEGFLKYRKQQIRAAELDNFLTEDNDLNFLQKSRKYEFVLEDYDFFNDAFVYKISFQPKGGADYKGVMYVNTEDFAVLRVDYENVKSLRKLSLLGISYNEYEKSGTIIFQQNANDKYSLKYMDESTGQKVGIKRPIKIIEKNKNVKGRRKQNEVACKVHFIVRNVQKKELIVFETADIAQADFDNFKEDPNVLPTYLTAYDPNFWEGYNIIEPNEAIKNWKIIEQTSESSN